MKKWGNFFAHKSYLLFDQNPDLKQWKIRTKDGLFIYDKDESKWVKIMVLIPSYVKIFEYT